MTKWRPVIGHEYKFREFRKECYEIRKVGETKPTIFITLEGALGAALTLSQLEETNEEIYT